MAKKNVQSEEIVEKVVEETIEVNAEETEEVNVEETEEAKAEETEKVKVEETEEAKAEETTEVEAGETTDETIDETPEMEIEKFVYIREKLKNKHFQHPDDLCDFVNTNDIDIMSIVAYDRFQALYYYENK